MRSTLRNINNIVRISFKNQPKLRVPVTKRTYSQNNNQESWRNFSSSFGKNQIIPKSQSAFGTSGVNWSLIGGIALGTVASTVFFGYSSQDESAHAKTAKTAEEYLKELENITTWEQGMKILAEAIAEHPKNIDFYIIAQKAAMEGGDLKTSQKYLEQGLKLEPKNPTLWIGKFFFHISEGKPEEALKAINRAIELAPNDHRGYAFRSSYYATHKDYEKAFQDADMAVQKLAKDAPKEERQSVLWGKWLVQIAPFLESQNFEQATRMLDLAIAECPNMMEPVILQFGLHFQNKDVDKAMKSLEKGFKNFPGDSYLYTLKANLLIATGRFKEAGVIIDAMQKVNAKDPTALALQSLMMMMNKKNEEAKKLLDLSKQYANSGEAVSDPELLVATWESIEKEIGVSKPAKKGWF